jgi:hypothetical protein
MKAKKGFITITSENESFQVGGFIFGDWGYHRTLLDYGGIVVPSKKDWTVTHIHSGLYAMQGLATMKQARELAMRLEKELPVCRGDMSDDFKDKAMKIIREVLDL